MVLLLFVVVRGGVFEVGLVVAYLFGSNLLFVVCSRCCIAVDAVVAENISRPTILSIVISSIGNSLLPSFFLLFVLLLMLVLSNFPSLYMITRMIPLSAMKEVSSNIMSMSLCILP